MIEMVAQIAKTERKQAMVVPTTPAQERKLRVLIPYDGSETAEATLKDLSTAGLPRELDALIAVTQVWLPSSPYEITSAVSARRLKLLTSGLSSHVPALQEHEEQRVLSLEAERRLRSQFPEGRVKTEAIEHTAAMSQAILERAKRWGAELIILGAKTSESSSSHDVVNVVGERIWPKGTIANLVFTRKPGPRQVTRDDEVAQILDAWADTLRATGLEVSTAIEDGQPEKVLLRRSEESSVDCVFVDPHQGDVDASGLSAGAKALIPGAQCSVEVVRASRTNDHDLTPAA